MPLTAMRRDTDEYFYVGDHTDDELKQMVDDGVKWDCRDCGIEMTVVAMYSTRVKTHFRHVFRNEECWFDNESEQHVIGKMAVLEVIKEWPEYRGYKFELEKKVDVPNGAKPYRRADVVAISPSGEVIAHEVQLSYQPPETFEERQRDYYRAGGIKTYWWVGGACATRAVLDWLSVSVPENGFLRIEGKPRVEKEYQVA